MSTPKRNDPRLLDQITRRMMQLATIGPTALGAEALAVTCAAFLSAYGGSDEGVEAFFATIRRHLAGAPAEEAVR